MESPEMKRNESEAWSNPDVNQAQNERKRTTKRYAKNDGRSQKKAKTNIEENTNQSTGNVRINVKMSLNDNESKSVIQEKMNKAIKPYFYVFNITARKQIKAPKVKLLVLRKQMQDDQPLPLLPPGMKTKFVSVTPPGTIHNR